MVVIDDYSRYPEAIIIPSLQAKTVIPELDKIFSRHGIPKVVRTDNGPPMNSEDFAKFANYLGFTHRKCTPLWPRANGEAERFISTLIKSIRASVKQKKTWKQELCKFLRQYRATPHSTTNVSPFELLYGRKMSIMLPDAKRELRDFAGLRERDAQMKRKMKANADKSLHARESNIAIGDTVLAKQKKRNMLSTPYDPNPMTVTKRKGNCVTAKGGNGSVIKRNSSFFKRFEGEPSESNHRRRLQREEVLKTTS
ncbi:hypothetical protein BSL78_06157 [Apostichopus japonicus]|uniref:Integrase catalytic domain-containing protein n=1 Tax=Stichopus japonicus TaxID=307972 RepID=A0A2G8L9M6_STIJA|nr:hypothetical protein BSL78_06157 [Apostichopus japonicus]